MLLLKLSFVFGILAIVIYALRAVLLNPARPILNSDLTNRLRITAVRIEASLAGAAAAFFALTLIVAVLLS